MTLPEGSTRRTDARTNRTRILQAAQAVFAQRGLELEMNEVAAQAHLGVATLYGHFANRQELLRAILQAILDEVLERFRSARTSHPDDPRAALVTFVSIGVHLQDHYRSLASVLRDPRFVELMDPAAVSQMRQQFLEIPKAILTQGVQCGVFRADLDQDIAAVIIMGALISIMDLLETSQSLADLTERLTQSLLMMVRGQASPEAL